MSSPAGDIAADGQPHQLSRRGCRIFSSYEPYYVEAKPPLLTGALVGELGEMAGDDEVLPRHADALEDPWTTSRASRSRDQGI